MTKEAKVKSSQKRKKNMTLRDHISLSEWKEGWRNAPVIWHHFLEYQKIKNENFGVFHPSYQVIKFVRVRRSHLPTCPHNKINHTTKYTPMHPGQIPEPSMQGQPHQGKDGYSSFKLPIKFRNTSNNTASSFGSPSGKELLSAWPRARARALLRTSRM